MTTKIDSSRGTHSKNYLIAFAILFALISALLCRKCLENSDRQVNELDQQAANMPFFIAHVLDPAEGGHRYTSWRRNEWIEWLNQRDIFHQAANPNRKASLFNKGLNTILIARPSEVINAFNGNLQIPSSEEHDQGYFWGNTLFLSFVFQKTSSGLVVYECPPSYILVKIIRKMPVHLHRQSLHKNEVLKLSIDCKKVLD